MCGDMFIRPALEVIRVRIDRLHLGFGIPRSDKPVYFLPGREVIFFEEFWPDSRRIFWLRATH